MLIGEGGGGGGEGAGEGELVEVVVVVGRVEDLDPYTVRRTGQGADEC